MGVVHKLKEDVVSFILAQKKQDPAVGVRKLALLASEKFQINISKSSINNVLKNADLSSAVGRRAGSGSAVKAEKFSIPSAKKTEILKNMQQAGFVKEHESAPLAEVKGPLEGIEAEKASEAEPLPLRTGSSVNAQSDAHVFKALPQEGRPPEEAESTLAQDASQDFGFLEQVEKFRALQRNKGAALRGAGLVFLKAAQWALSGRHLMEGLIKKCLKGSLSGHFHVASDMYLFLQFLGVKTADDISSYHDHGIWPLNDCRPWGPDESSDLLELKQLFQGDSAFPDAVIRTLIMEYGIEKENTFLEVKGYKLYLEDGSELAIDAQMSSMSGSTFGASWDRRCLPVHRALTVLSDCLIANIRDCVFQRAPGEVKFSRPFYDMVAVFENLPGKRILKVTMITKDNDEFTEFSAIPAQKRIFVAGVSPRQEEFKALTKFVKWAAKTPYYHEETDKVYYFTETKSDLWDVHSHGPQNEVTVVTIWQPNDNDSIGAILTNQGKETGKAILEKYISSWPYFDAEKRGVSQLIGEPLQQAKQSGSIDSFSGMFLDFSYCLHHYAVSHFFPQNIAYTDLTDYISNIYNISGRIYKSDDSILVALDVPRGHKYHDDLGYAVKQVNESKIYDYSGRRLWIRI